MKKSKGNSRLAVDTNALIAYREGISEVCTLVNEMDIIFFYLLLFLVNYFTARLTVLNLKIMSKR